jgi:uncharacterized protein
VRLAVKVVPGARRDRIAGWLGDAVKVTVAAAPERGRANAAVARLLGEALGVPVRLLDGARSARKVFDVPDLDEPSVRRRLEAIVGASRGATRP